MPHTPHSQPYTSRSRPQKMSNEEPTALTPKDQLTVFAHVFIGPSTAGGLGNVPIASRTRKRIQVTTAHAIADLSWEQAELLRDWLVVRLAWGPDNPVPTAD